MNEWMNEWFLPDARLDHCHYCFHMLTNEFSDTPFDSIITQSQLSCHTDVVILSVLHTKKAFLLVCVKSLSTGVYQLFLGEIRWWDKSLPFTKIFELNIVRQQKIKGINAVPLHYYEAKGQPLSLCPILSAPSKSRVILPCQAAHSGLQSCVKNVRLLCCRWLCRK